MSATPGTRRCVVLHFKNTLVRSSASLLTCALTIPVTYAFEVQTENSDVKFRWDNTVKYSSALRLKSADAALMSNPNTDDGDHNFKKGLISSRLDLLSEIDVSYRDIGARVSGAAWYDSIYERNNGNPGFAGGAFPNQTSVASNQFTAATKKIHGSNAEFLDAFVYGKLDLGKQRVAVRAGKYAQQWGESLFLGANAIAGGMGPVDVVKLTSVPNTQFKEAIRPVQQISGQVQLTSDISIGAYYQYRWQPNRLPAVGSYFSQIDIVPDGGEQLLLAGPGSIFAANAPRLDDQRARNSGQGGFQFRYRADETDYGLYLIRFHNKNFQSVTNIGLVPTTIPAAACSAALHAQGIPIGTACFLAGGPTSYRLAYHEGINAFGGSASHAFDGVNLAIEASIRNNQDLASTGAVDLSALGVGAAANNSGNPAYATGNTAHVNISGIWSFQPNALFRESTFTGEIAWNRVLHIARNPSAVDPLATRDATAFRGVFTPAFRQVLPGLDLELPIGLGFSPKGSRSMALGSGALPPDGGGDISIGVETTYLNVWKAGLNYTHFFGSEGTFLNAANGYSYKQSLHDRDFVSFSIRTTF